MYVTKETLCQSYVSGTKYHVFGHYILFRVVDPIMEWIKGDEK